MKQFNINEINTIPLVDRGRANEIALAILNDNYDLKPIMGFLPFFDSDISNSIFKKAMEQEDDIEELIMAINPFIDRALNDILTHKAMEQTIRAEDIAEKLFPFISIDVASELAEYAIKHDCDAEDLLNAAILFVNSETADKIMLYAIDKEINPEFFAMRVLPVMSKDVKQRVNDYLKNSGVEMKLSMVIPKEER